MVVQHNLSALMVRNFHLILLNVYVNQLLSFFLHSIFVLFCAIVNSDQSIPHSITAYKSIPREIL